MPVAGTSPLPAVALVGKPNVGKSSLFNRILGKKLAIVHDSAGVTRDILSGHVALNATSHILLTDSPGYGTAAVGCSDFSEKMEDRAKQAGQLADLVLMVCDGTHMPDSEDSRIARELHKTGNNTFLLVNKTDFGDESRAADYYQFGFPVFCVSAHSGFGLKKLLAAVADMPGLLRSPDEDEDKKEAEAPENSFRSFDNSFDAADAAFALLGKPNVGKSSIFNCLLGEERQLVDAKPGSTRDAVRLPFFHRKLKIRLCDTAGVRKKNRIREDLDKKATAEALGAAAEADLVLYLLDATTGLETQDMRLLHLIHRMGKASVVAVNKSDLLTKQERVSLNAELEGQLSSLDYVPRVFVSATKKQGITKLLHTALKVREQTCGEWDKKLLNSVLTEATTQLPPPMPGGIRPQLRYVRQEGTNPPSFFIHGKRLDRLPASYVRYLQRSFRDALNIGVVRISLKNDPNPYDKRRPAGRFVSRPARHPRTGS